MTIHKQEMSLKKETKGTYAYENPMSSFCTGLYVRKAAFPSGAPACLYVTLSDEPHGGAPHVDLADGGAGGDLPQDGGVPHADVQDDGAQQERPVPGAGDAGIPS